MSIRVSMRQFTRLGNESDKHAGVFAACNAGRIITRPRSVTR